MDARRRSRILLADFVAENKQSVVVDGSVGVAVDIGCVARELGVSIFRVTGT